MMTNPDAASPVWAQSVSGSGIAACSIKGQSDTIGIMVIVMGWVLQTRDG